MSTSTVGPLSWWASVGCSMVSLSMPGRRRRCRRGQRSPTPIGRSGVVRTPSVGVLQCVDGSLDGVAGVFDDAFAVTVVGQPRGEAFDACAVLPHHAVGAVLDEGGVTGGLQRGEHASDGGDLTPEGSGTPLAVLDQPPVDGVDVDTVGGAVVVVGELLPRLRDDAHGCFLSRGGRPR